MRSTNIICIVDDDAAVRDALTLMIESVGFEPRAFASANDFLDEAHELDASCVLLDMRMPGISGLECQARMKELGVSVPVIFLTGHGDVSSAVRALKLGAADYLEKPLSDQQQLLDRVAECVRIHAEDRENSVRQETARQRLAALTEREREIALLVGKGKANKVIAIELGISERTVEVHRSRALHKLGLRNVPELVALLNLAGSETD